eukprot:TRINITY_DN2953_c0_g1_i1.p3 TRINITY_DN2953_c0_g1~~TRINITY_DN2953_c0_g1_i1.p3  ORF type:complete len:198 (+),score=66.55 TRINITY_DN2953_c0_g1_i1:234-827(+)
MADADALERTAEDSVVLSARDVLLTLEYEALLLQRVHQKVTDQLHRLGFEEAVLKKFLATSQTTGGVVDIAPLLDPARYQPGAVLPDRASPVTDDDPVSPAAPPPLVGTAAGTAPGTAAAEPPPPEGTQRRVRLAVGAPRLDELEREVLERVQPRREVVVEEGEIEPASPVLSSGGDDDGDDDDGDDDDLAAADDDD